MQLEQHSAADFAEAIKALMPPGVVWEWGQGASSGLGEALMTGPAQELARVDAEVNPLLAAAVDLHRPKALSWRLVDYRAVAEAACPGARVSTQVPLTAGSRVGSRAWSVRARYALVVSCDLPTNIVALKSALDAFKQAHMGVFYGV